MNIFDPDLIALSKTDFQDGVLYSFKLLGSLVAFNVARILINFDPSIWDDLLLGLFGTIALTVALGFGVMAFINFKSVINQLFKR